VDMMYEYKPRPPEAEVPPILPHEFELALNACVIPCRLAYLPFHDCIEPLLQGKDAITLIPKRKHAWEIGLGTREPAWGLQAQFCISFIRVLFYHFLMILGTFVFWIWWQITHPDDIQNASTPLTVVAVFISLFWSSSGVLKIFREPRR
jgi:hypothetical protein